MKNRSKLIINNWFQKKNNLKYKIKIIKMKFLNYKRKNRFRIKFKKNNKKIKIHKI